ncbi:AAA family ATPase [Stutzerimonas zhaodongensis]|uniref:AAA family ATPase n=1 Tax=Stutzerimonas zhaodongensis TaxID=1176257 RepID=UPI0021083BAD|nr:AAA family ATPase [Stutzerimonas zhaodongensis]MCQ2029877.1 AAA family ATPase [Stutzerimonas zhaodongensis]
MISSLRLKNFAAFSDLSIDFSPGINIVLGENGTGKTQLLKAILALNGEAARGELAGEQLARTLCRLYHPLSNKVGALRRAGSRAGALLSATYASGQHITAKFNGSATEAKVSGGMGAELAPAIFIPTKEVLSLVRGLTAEESHLPTIERIFDDGYLDLANTLRKDDDGNLQKKTQNNPRFSSIVPRLTNLIGGRYLLKEGGFCFQAGIYVDQQGESITDEELAPQSFKDSKLSFVPTKFPLMPSGMTAEGFRKIGVLQRLLSNGSLNPGTSGPLLWDEPESNLNPKLMKDLVLALLELARNGQQVILATHDYVLLKWFDLLMDKGKGDHVVFHRLYREAGSDDIQLESQADYSIVGRSAISNTFAELYDEDVKRALGGE